MYNYSHCQAVDAHRLTEQINSIIIMISKNIYQVQQILITSPGSQEEQICPFDVNTLADACVAAVLILIEVFIIVRAVIQYRITVQQSRMNRTIRLIYTTIFIWGALFMARMVMNETFFIIYSRNKPNQTDFRFIAKASKFLFIIITMGVYMIHSAVLLAAFNWVCNIVDFFEDLQDLLDIFCKKFLKIFIPLRFLVFVFVVPYFITDAQSMQDNIMRAVLFVLLVNDLLVIAILSLQIYSIKRNTKLSQIISQSQILSMIKRYMLLIVCIGIRAAIQIYFNLEAVKASGNKCTYDLQNDYLKNKSMVYLLMRCLISNYLTIFSILIIYKIDWQRQEQESLIHGSHQYRESRKNNTNVVIQSNTNTDNSKSFSSKQQEPSIIKF